MVFAVVFAYGASLFKAYPVRFDDLSAAALIVALTSALLTAVAFLLSVMSSAFLDYDVAYPAEDDELGSIRSRLLRASIFVYGGLGRCVFYVMRNVVCDG